MSTPTAPDWLKLHDGTLAAGVGPETVFVSIAGRPQYRLDARPAQNQFLCSVTQTVNGKRLNEKAGYPTAEAALVGGLTQLRETLGW